MRHILRWSWHKFSSLLACYSGENPARLGCEFWSTTHVYHFGLWGHGVFAMSMAGKEHETCQSCPCASEISFWVLGGKLHHLKVVPCKRLQGEELCLITLWWAKRHPLGYTASCAAEGWDLCFMILLSYSEISLLSAAESYADPWRPIAAGCFLPVVREHMLLCPKETPAAALAP